MFGNLKAILVVIFTSKNASKLTLKIPQKIKLPSLEKVCHQPLYNFFLISSLSYALNLHKYHIFIFQSSSVNMTIRINFSTVTTSQISFLFLARNLGSKVSASSFFIKCFHSHKQLKPSTLQLITHFILILSQK